MWRACSIVIGIGHLRSVQRWLLSLNPVVPDAILALVLFGLAYAQSLPVSRSSAPLNALLIALETLPLAFRRRAPLVVVLVTGAGAVGHLVAGFHNGFFDTFSTLVAVYSVAAHSPRRQSLTLLVILPLSLTVALLVDWHNRGGVNLVDIPYNGLLFGSAWVLGDSIRARRLYAEQIQDRERLLASERVERERATVAEERARIARELHDIVAHSVSVMVLQANAGERIASGKPDQAAAHFGVIQATGRQALGEMRRLLAVLRGHEAEGELSPQPQLGDLEALAEQIRRSGLETSVHLEGDLGTLPETVQLSAYRIIQEALTNAIRHAEASQAAIEVRRTAKELQVRVDDNGQGKASANGGPGHGLIGMRERVQLFGGTLEAGPRAAGGFRVEARLPLPGEAP